MPRTALIVDDSRTALVSLSRMLHAQGIRADTVESGPEALNYLRSNAHPGVVFLDHMMPGMDGFQTLSALKADARTATLPVVMYTTQDGDAYMGQALSLGAIGVLHKPVNSAELSSILQRVDRLRVPTATAPASASNPVRGAVTGVIDVPAEFRAATSTVATRAAESGGAVPLATAKANPASSSRGWRFVRALFPVLAGLVLLLPGGWYYQRYQQSDRQRQVLRAEIERLQNEQHAAALARAQQMESEQQVTDASTRRGWLDALTWAVNLRSQYGFGEEPLNDARLSILRELIQRLTTAGFRGVVRLETHVGEFCVSRDDQGATRLPADNQPFSRCEVLRYPPAQAEYLGRRQSPAFARFLAQEGEGPVRIQIVSFGTSRPVVSTPDLNRMQTAGDWNQPARLNQRVEIVLLPSP